jgi:hypothetical protein
MVQKQLLINTKYRKLVIRFLMEKQKLFVFFLIVVFTFTIIGCSSGNRIGGSSKHCGCGMNKGMVGF